MTRVSTTFVARLLIAIASAMAIAAVQAAEGPSRRLSLENKPWKGDFEEMLAVRRIRILVPFSRTLYYVDKGRERGITADLAREFERHINKKYAKQLGKRPVTVILIPTTRDRLLSGLSEGRGDIAAGNITVTEARLKLMDFATTTDGRPINEVIVAGPKAPAVATLEDLAGRTLHVQPATSYYESALALNERLKNARKAPVKIVLLPDALEDEDKLEMLNAGLFEFVIVDDWLARIWAPILPKIKVRDDLVLRGEGRPGWAIRKGSPQLAAALQDAFQNILKKESGISVRQAQYRKRVKQISDNTGTAEWKRFEETLALFEKYGSKYGFDPVMLAAQGFQESQLNQDMKSRVGAVGVMQIMPATGKGLGVGDIHEIEPNIHGGAKYMDQLLTRYFEDAKFSETDRTLFAFASYNAGPGNISKMRKEAVKAGLDPDKWFGNVEIVAAQKLGLETTTYVRNIYKYYAAYKLTIQAQDATRKAREKVERKS